MLKKWDELTQECRNAVIYELDRWEGKRCGADAVFDRLISIATTSERRWSGFDPASPGGDRTVHIAVDPKSFTDVKRGEFERLEQVVASLSEIGPGGTDRYKFMDVTRGEFDDLKKAVDVNLKTAFTRIYRQSAQIAEIGKLIERCVGLAERNSARLSAIEGAVDVGLAELHSRVDALTPPRLRPRPDGESDRVVPRHAKEEPASPPDFDEIIEDNPLDLTVKPPFSTYTTEGN